MLATPAAGLADLKAEQLQGALLLFADTLHHPQALERLLGHDFGRLPVASQPTHSAPRDVLIGLRMEPHTAADRARPRRAHHSRGDGARRLLAAALLGLHR